MEIQFENLLKYNGYRWEAEQTKSGNAIKGEVLIEDGFVTLTHNGISNYYLKEGTKLELATAGLNNFRLLEPGEPESKEKCKNCNGLGVMEWPDNSRCPVCSGTGTIKKESEKDGCICGNCGKKYGIDLIVTDEQWAKISKRLGFKDGGGLLCGSCIMEELENIQMYGAYKLMYPETLTKRENVSTQLLAGMLSNSGWKGVDVSDEILVLKSIELTDLLLKKLGDK